MDDQKKSNVIPLKNPMLEKAEKEVAERKTHLVIAARLDGTKGFSQHFVLQLISTLRSNGILASYEFSPASLGLESSGPFFNVLVEPTDLAAAKEVIQQEMKK